MLIALVPNVHRRHAALWPTKQVRKRLCTHIAVTLERIRIASIFRFPEIIRESADNVATDRLYSSQNSPIQFS
jgi:hypothetical protein